jgi:parallel beta-helix repeat protein
MTRTTMTRTTRAFLPSATVAAALALAVSAVVDAPTVWARTPDTHTVLLHPGSSIQGAIDAAPPRTTIVLKAGTYHGNLTIAKTLSLRADGAVIIEPAARTAHNACTDDRDLPAPETTGICIGRIGPGEKIITTVRHVTLSGFTIRGFSGQGIFAAGTSELRVDHVEAAHNGDYGIIADLSDHLSFRSDRVHDNVNGGIHLSGDHTVNATGNRSYRNTGEGILFTDSSGGRIQANHLTENCSGLLALDTGFPGGTSAVRITANTVERNDRYCPPGSGQAGRPAEGGLGVALAGTTNAVVSDNRITSNILAGVPAGAPSPMVQGGMALLDSTSFGGRTPAHNRIIRNTIRGNTPLDVLTDGSGSGNLFQANSCATASTPGICG